MCGIGAPPPFPWHCSCEDLDFVVSPLTRHASLDLPSPAQISWLFLSEPVCRLDGINRTYRLGVHLAYWSTVWLDKLPVRRAARLLHGGSFTQAHKKAVLSL